MRICVGFKTQFEDNNSHGGRIKQNSLWSLQKPMDLRAWQWPSVSTSRYCNRPRAGGA